MRAIRERLASSPDRYALVVIDPISAYMEGTDANSNTEVRRLLAQLATMAADTQCAVVVISHLRKSGGGKAIYRTMGSLAFTAAARAVWTVLLDPEDNRRRFFLPVKLNLAATPVGLAYSIIDGRCQWDTEPVTQTVDELVSTRPPQRTDRSDECTESLSKLLAGGPQPVTEVHASLQQSGYTQREIRTARRALDVVTSHPSPTAPWLLSLPRRLKGLEDAG